MDSVCYSEFFHSKDAVGRIKVPAVVCVVYRDLNRGAHHKIVSVGATHDCEGRYFFILTPGCIVNGVKIPT